MAPSHPWHAWTGDKKGKLTSRTPTSRSRTLNKLASDHSENEGPDVCLGIGQPERPGSRCRTAPGTAASIRQVSPDSISQASPDLPDLPNRLPERPGTSHSQRTKPSAGQKAFCSKLVRCASPDRLSRKEDVDVIASLNDVLRKTDEEKAKLKIQTEVMTAELASLRTLVGVPIAEVGRTERQGESQALLHVLEALRERLYLGKMNHKDTFALVTRARSELIASSTAKGFEIDIDTVLLIADAALSLADLSKCFGDPASSSAERALSPHNMNSATSASRPGTSLTRPATSSSQQQSPHGENEQLIEKSALGWDNGSEEEPYNPVNHLAECVSVHFTKPKGNGRVANFLNMLANPDDDSSHSGRVEKKMKAGGRDEEGRRKGGAREEDGAMPIQHAARPETKVRVGKRTLTGESNRTREREDGQRRPSKSTSTQTDEHNWNAKTSLADNPSSNDDPHSQKCSGSSAPTQAASSSGRQFCRAATINSQKQLFFNVSSGLSETCSEIDIQQADELQDQEGQQEQQKQGAPVRAASKDSAPSSSLKEPFAPTAPQEPAAKDDQRAAPGVEPPSSRESLPHETRILFEDATVRRLTIPDDVSEEEQHFPNCLGPFGVLGSEEFREIAIQIETDEDEGLNTWCLHKDAAIWSYSPELERLSECIATWPIRGKINPLQPLDCLDDEEEDNIGAPIAASYFTWSTPVPIDFNLGSEDIVAEVANAGSPEVAFVLRGGFVFCDEVSAICGVCTITPGSPGTGLQFGKPLPWKSEWTAALETRFSRITIQALKEKGACHYCWVRPDEPLLRDLCPPELKRGGFVYLFHEEIIPKELTDFAKDRVFPLEEVGRTIADRKTLKGFQFVDDNWHRPNLIQTPYVLLTKAMQDLRSNGNIGERKYRELIDAITELNSGQQKGNVVLDMTDQEAGVDTMGMASWLGSLGVTVERKDSIKSNRKSLHRNKTLARKTKRTFMRRSIDVDNDDSLSIARVSFGKSPSAQKESDREKLGDLAFNCWSTPRNEIVPLMMSAYELWPWELMLTFSIDEKVLRNWIVAIEEQYQKNQYHNWQHAWDVFQFVCVELTEGLDSGCLHDMQADSLTAMDVLALLSASLSHDVAHPGVTNQFLCRTHDDLAITYNDASPLQNMHSAMLFRTLREGNDRNFLEALSSEQYSAFRELSMQAILSNDMLSHFKVVDEINVATMINVEASEVEAKLVVSAFLKLADMSNSLRPWASYRRSIACMEQEFFAQGDVERERGLPISPMMDRHKDLLIDYQQGFTNFIVCPLLQVVTRILPAIGPVLEESLENNTAKMCEHKSEIWMAKLHDNVDVGDDADEEMQLDDDEEIQLDPAL